MILAHHVLPPSSRVTSRYRSALGARRNDRSTELVEACVARDVRRRVAAGNYTAITAEAGMAQVALPIASASKPTAALGRRDAWCATR